MVDIAEDSRRKHFRVAVAIAVVVAVVGTVGVLWVTGYESRETVEFATPGNALMFVVHLRADGPFSTYKDVTLLSVQVLAFPDRDIRTISLVLSGGEEGLWSINITRRVDVTAGLVPPSGFWTAADAQGRIVFTEDGERPVWASIWTDPGGYGTIDPYGAGNANVTVLPKETDILWTGTRASAIGVVLGVAFIAGPQAVKDFRDLRLGK